MAWITHIRPCLLDLLFLANRIPCLNIVPSSNRILTGKKPAPNINNLLALSSARVSTVAVYIYIYILSCITLFSRFNEALLVANNVEVGLLATVGHMQLLVSVGHMQSLL